VDELTLTPAQEEALREELVDALEAMMDRSCADMAPLWLDATREARSYLSGAEIREMPFALSESYLALGKASHSKYRGLATWRHAVLWCEVLEVIDDAEFRDAMTCVYFTAFPKNEPPYAWTRSAKRAPGVERFASATSLKNQAKEGCFRALKALVQELESLLDDGSWEKEVRAMFLRAATRRSLWDVLKLEDHPSEEVYG